MTEYVRGHVHTNGLENFWSLLKRAIMSTWSPTICTAMLRNRRSATTHGGARMPTASWPRCAASSVDG
jgi:hypothetical protein